MDSNCFPCLNWSWHSSWVGAVCVRCISPTVYGGEFSTVGSISLCSSFWQGLEHTYFTHCSGGMASALQVLEIAHTHFWMSERKTLSPGSSSVSGRPLTELWFQCIWWCHTPLVCTRVTESMVKSEFSVPRGTNVSISATDDDSKIWWWSDKIYSWPPPNPFSHCKT